MNLESNYLKKELYDLVQSDSTIFDFLQSGSLDGIWYWDLQNPANEWMSPQFWRVLGHDPKDKKHLADEWQDLIHPEDLKVALDNFEKHCADPGHPYDQIVRYLHSDGSTVWVRCRGMAIRDKSGKPVRMLGAHTDLTRQKQAEEQLKASLKEKETLLQEVHHRVKNNMQVISSLLKLQANTIEDSQIKDVLKESQGRIFAMSAVHETLHGSENLSEIDLKSYLSKITTSVFQTYSIDHFKAKLKSDIDNVPISINHAYPLGLIINELISNSLKYAFPDEREGEITVSMKKLHQELELIVKDDGIGIPDEIDWSKSSTLGLKLVRTLVENQLDGSIDMESNSGTKFTIKFNIDINES